MVLGDMKSGATTLVNSDHSTNFNFFITGPTTPLGLNDIVRGASLITPQPAR